MCGIASSAGCSCPSCVGIVRADFYITSPWYFNRGEAWSENPTLRKPRPPPAAIGVWQHVVHTYDWVELFTTIDHRQRQVKVWMDHYRSTYEWPEATQVRLSLMD